MNSHRIALRQVLQVAGIVILTANLTACKRSRPGAPDAAPKRTQEASILQPVQEYSLSFEEKMRDVEGNKQDLNPFRFYTHIGTDYGRMGPGETKITWKPGQVCVDLRFAGWAGMWHSLAGLAREKDHYLDFMKCYPYVHDEYQTKCVGMTVRAQGKGFLKLELKSPEERVLWQKSQELNTGEEWRELGFSWSPADFRKVKFLNWVAEPGAKLCIDSIHLVVEFPKIPFDKKTFLISYAKLARSYSPSDGIVKDRANWPAGDFDSIPASGLFCLATCAAWKIDIVDRAFAEQTLLKVYSTVSSLPKANGLLPHFIRKYEGKYRIHHDTEYSTADTSIYYHSMLLAAQMLSDGETLAGLTKAVKEIQFDRLRNADGYVIHGIKDDGRTALASFWRDWGGESVLVLLLERMAAGDQAKLKMSKSGEVHDGVGFIGEIQSLFYPHFAADEPDAITGVNWLKARRDLLKKQMDYFPKTWPDSAAAKLGVYGLSAGEGFRGVGYAANGTQTPKAKLIHPHYILMSGLIRPRPADTYTLLKTMESRGLIPPWGMVENVTVDLSDYLPMLGSLNGSFECISAYHLWVKATGQPDQIYEAATSCLLLDEAVRAFYPGRP